MAAPGRRRFLLTEAAAYLDVSARELRRLVQRRLIVHHRVTPRGRIYFYQSELDEHIAATRIAASGLGATRVGRDISHLLPADRLFS